MQVSKTRINNYWNNVFNLTKSYLTFTLLLQFSVLYFRGLPCQEYAISNEVRLLQKHRRGFFLLQNQYWA